MENIFRITNKALTENGASYTIEIDPKHKVFEGHFPGNPVLPGVVSLLMVRRCAEEMLGLKSHFASIKDIKYLQAIIPDGTPLTVNISCAEKTVTGEILSTESVCLMKMKGTLA